MGLGLAPLIFLPLQGLGAPEPQYTNGAHGYYPRIQEATHQEAQSIISIKVSSGTKCVYVCLYETWVGWLIIVAVIFCVGLNVPYFLPALYWSSLTRLWSSTLQRVSKDRRWIH